MKNAHFEARRHHKWKPITARATTVTRAILVRAFSTPDRCRRDVVAIVAQYMGDSPVPPCWGRLGIRGTFGRDIERLWSRHIRGLHAASYRDRESGRFLTPVVQTAYDFGTTPEALRKSAELPSDISSAENVGHMILSDLMAMVKSTHSSGSKADQVFPVFMDEYHCYTGLPSATRTGLETSYVKQ